MVDVSSLPLAITEGDPLHDEAHQLIHAALRAVDAAGDLLVGAGADSIVRLAKGAALDGLRVNAAGTALEWAAEGLIAQTHYGPGSNSALNTTSTTLVDIDATNLAATFTVPASGKVLVVLQGVVTCGTDDIHFGLREGSTTVGPVTMLGRTTNRQLFSCAIPVTGLTPGAVKTYKWAWAVASAVTATFSYGPGGINVFPKALMQVYAVNV